MGLAWDQAIDQRRQQVQTIVTESWHESLRSRASKGEPSNREAPFSFGGPISRSRPGEDSGKKDLRFCRTERARCLEERPPEPLAQWRVGHQR